MNLSYFDLCRSAPALSGGGTLCMSICRRKKGKGKRKFNGYFIAYRLTLLEDLPNSKPCTIIMLYHYIITIVYCRADYSIIMSYYVERRKFFILLSAYQSASHSQPLSYGVLPNALRIHTISVRFLFC